jgi:PIN domain nuclease of toxin-antitoxin system
VKAIVDTRILLQALADDPNLSEAARDVLTDPENEIYASAASVTEIGIKFLYGKISADPPTIVEAGMMSGFTWLEVSKVHWQTMADLGWHSDAYSRIIVAQSIAEPMKLLTADWRLAAYGGPVILV